MPAQISFLNIQWGLQKSFFASRIAIISLILVGKELRRLFGLMRTALFEGGFDEEGILVIRRPPRRPTRIVSGPKFSYKSNRYQFWNIRIVEKGHKIDISGASRLMRLGDDWEGGFPA